jgi:hypothetical protein
LLILYKLADRLCKTVAELQATMTREEAAGWLAYFQMVERKEI